MGADLSGYILVGPETITDEAIKKAAAKLMQLKTLGKQECQNCGAKLDDDGHCGDCGQPAPIDVSKLTDEASAIEAVKTLVSEWPPDFRDSCIRSNPDTPGELIVFAGEMSWGGEPCGRGYEVLRDIENSGVYKELGFK